MSTTRRMRRDRRQQEIKRAQRLLVKVAEAAHAQGFPGSVDVVCGSLKLDLRENSQNRRRTEQHTRPQARIAHNGSHSVENSVNFEAWRRRLGDCITEALLFSGNVGTGHNLTLGYNVAGHLDSERIKDAGFGEGQLVAWLAAKRADEGYCLIGDGLGPPCTR